MSPCHRPPLGLRVVIALLGVASVAFNAALMLSDRAPRVSRRIGGDIIARLSERLDTGGRPGRLMNDPRLPSSDAIVHIGVWGVAMVFVGLAIWNWRGLVIGAVTVFAVSAMVEIGQHRLTATRTFEIGDIIANGIGVLLGTVVAAGCYLLWSGAARLFATRHPAPSAPPTPDRTSRCTVDSPQGSSPL